MAYQLRPELPIADEARRALLEQVDGALAGFDRLEPPSAVHEARKACKRARALLSLVGRGLGRKRARAVARLYRDAARHISSLRDAAVMKQTLGGLMDTGAPELATPTPGAAEVTARLDAAIQGLREARAASELLPWEQLTRRRVLDGFEAGYRSARRGYRDALEAPGADPMHDWRKAAKANLYHWELLLPLWAPVLGAIHGAIDELQDVLGDHNDLAVLDDYLDRAALGSDAGMRVDARLHARVAELRTRAFDLSAAVYAVPPTVYGSLLLSLWKRGAQPAAAEQSPADAAPQPSPETSALA